MKKPSGFYDNWYIFAYDITKDRSRRKISEILTDNGLSRVNKSVYEGRLSRNAFSKICRAVSKYLKKSDSLIIYPVSNYNISKKKILAGKKKEKEKDGPFIF